MAFIFQFDVIARDPSGKTGSAFVTVNVVRDQPPVFQSTPYRKNVIENEPIGTGVFTVTAIDPDIKVGISCHIVFIRSSYNKTFWKI